MDNLSKYIIDNYDGNPNWFEDEVQTNWHLQRVRNFIDIMDYLDGKHKILNRPDAVWKGRNFKVRKITLQYVKPILTFEESFLLKNPVTLTSDDEETLNKYKEIYKKGKYDNLDIKLPRWIYYLLLY